MVDAYDPEDELKEIRLEFANEITDCSHAIFSFAVKQLLSWPTYAPASYLEIERVLRRLKPCAGCDAALKAMIQESLDIEQLLALRQIFDWAWQHHRDCQVIHIDDLARLISAMRVKRHETPQAFAHFSLVRLHRYMKRHPLTDRHITWRRGEEESEKKPMG